MADDIREHLNDLRGRVEEHLRQSLRQASDSPASLLEAMRYSMLAPAKRLRPLLVLLAAEAAGGTVHQALPAACAVEMVHTYSLIHDDLPAMDDDDLRRGQPTCHRQFGEALAILAGDALLTLAFGTLAASYPPATAAVCCTELARGAGAAGMVGGQVQDLAWEGRLPSGIASFHPQSAIRNPQLEDLETIHDRKTGALFRTCLRLGYWTAQGEPLGQGNTAMLEALDAYGRSFGQAFQITDDLLDVEGCPEQMGKQVHKDAARGKLTYPCLLGLEQSRQRAESHCRLAQAAVEHLGHGGRCLAALAETILHRER